MEWLVRSVEAWSRRMRLIKNENRVVESGLPVWFYLRNRIIIFSSSFLLPVWRVTQYQGWLTVWRIALLVGVEPHKQFRSGCFIAAVFLLVQQIRTFRPMRLLE